MRIRLAFSLSVFLGALAAQTALAQDVATSPAIQNQTTASGIGESTAAYTAGTSLFSAAAVRDAFKVQGTTAPDRRHKIGVGARIGGFALGIGGSVRYWQADAMALQVDFSHYGFTYVGLTQVAPSVLFVLGQPDLSKSTQIRPYAGGGLNIFHVSESDVLGDSDTGIGGQGFVGAEAIFSGLPNLGVSGDIGYYTTGTFFGISVGGIAVSISGHYYFK